MKTELLKIFFGSLHAHYMLKPDVKWLFVRYVLVFLVLLALVLTRPGARFSKVPIINGPGKLSPFTVKIEVSIVLHLT